MNYFRKDLTFALKCVIVISYLRSNTLTKGFKSMDYAVHTMPSYQNMQGTAKPAHMGSQSMAPTSAKGKNEGLKGSMTPSSDGSAHKVV